MPGEGWDVPDLSDWGWGGEGGTRGGQTQPQLRSSLQGEIKPQPEGGCRGGGQTGQTWFVCPLGSWLAVALGTCLHLAEPPWPPDLAEDENVWKGCEKADGQAQQPRRLSQDRAQATVFSRSILGWSASPENWRSGVSDVQALSIGRFIRLLLPTGETRPA